MSILFLILMGWISDSIAAGYNPVTLTYTPPTHASAAAHVRGK